MEIKVPFHNVRYLRSSFCFYFVRFSILPYLSEDLFSSTYYRNFRFVVVKIFLFRLKLTSPSGFHFHGTNGIRNCFAWFFFILQLSIPWQVFLLFLYFWSEILYSFWFFFSFSRETINITQNIYRNIRFRIAPFSQYWEEGFDYALGLLQSERWETAPSSIQVFAELGSFMYID